MYPRCLAVDLWPPSPIEPWKIASRDATLPTLHPSGCVDLAAFDDDGEPYQIHGCDDCLPWYAEVHLDDDGQVFVREWHAAECKTFQDLINLDDELPGD